MEHKWRKQYKKANVCYLMNFPGFTFYQQADGDMSFSVFFFFFSSTSVEVLLVWMLLKKKMTVKMDVSRSRSFLSVTSTDEDRARETCQGAISAALFTHGHDSSSKGLG